MISGWPFLYSADDRLRAQPVAPVQIVLCIDMGAVAAGIGAQVAVFVVEHLVDVDVEDVLPVGQRGELLIEAVEAGLLNVASVLERDGPTCRFAST